jgi:hypothetical protein
MYKANAKGDMARLLGNLAHGGGKQAQDLIREHGGLEGLLNSCQLDDRNPVIKEWCVLCNYYVLCECG